MTLEGVLDLVGAVLILLGASLALTAAIGLVRLPEEVRTLLVGFESTDQAGAATSAILAESGLSFLGIGDTTTVSWGSMLFWASNSNALLTGQWVLLFAPGLCIALLATSLTLINFGVDGLSNPRLREGSGR